FTLGNTAISVLYTLSLHAALPISVVRLRRNETARAEELGELQAVDRVHKRQSVVVHRALLLDELARGEPRRNRVGTTRRTGVERSEEHTSELQSRENLVCRRLLEK